jgi:hypothetical protein
MRKALMGAPALIVVAVSLGLTAGAAAKTTVHLRNTLIGAQAGGGENVYEVRGSVRGALVQFPKENTAGTGGSFTGTGYFGNGTVGTVGHYTNSQPDASGIVTINSTGRYVHGTGVYKHVSGKFTATGTLNTKNGQLRVTVVGTESY